MGGRGVKRAIGIAILVVSLVPLSVQPVEALAAYIHVTTAADVDAADGLCSLREAIIATNVGGGYRECPAGTTGTDTILFDVSVVNVGSQLPTITVPVYLGNTGGTRTQLHGPGSTTGLVFGSAADGSIVRNMYIENFATGIDLQGSDATIVGNVIGPNSGTGLHVSGAAITIGGANPRTPDACSGACNRISGNGGSGIEGNMAGLIKGNLIGLDASGTVAQANNIGIFVSGAITIGGETDDERNVISGNTFFGVDLGSYCTCEIKGNYIGTNASGAGAVPNAGGILVQGTNSGYIGSHTIGGSSAGQGNVISGNNGSGIVVYTWWSSQSPLDIYGNKVGVSAAGAPLKNGGYGIVIGGPDSAVGINVGDPSIAGTGNVIAYNGSGGVSLRTQFTTGDDIRGNSIHDNTGKGIELQGGANDNIVAPTITGTSPVAGTGCANCTIDVYSDSTDEGSTYEGSATADGSGNWTFAGTPAGPYVTATATAVDRGTSEFSAPAPLVSRKPDARIKKGSGSLVGNGIYNTTGLNQTRSGSTAPGNTIKFGISIQNDATASDQFKVHATGTSTTGYSIKYFHGTTDITAAVVAGTYTTPALPSGGTFLITAKVKVTSTALAGSSVTRLVTTISTADGTKQDAVKFVASRS